MLNVYIIIKDGCWFEKKQMAILIEKIIGQIND